MAARPKVLGQALLLDPSSSGARPSAWQRVGLWLFCLTFSMTDWDGGAVRRLRDLADGLDGRGATTVLRRRVQEAWRRNLDWHDEQEGDTNRSLGVHCSENGSGGPPAPPDHRT